MSNDRRKLASLLFILMAIPIVMPVASLAAIKAHATHEGSLPSSLPLFQAALGRNAGVLMMNACERVAHRAPPALHTSRSNEGKEARANRQRTSTFGFPRFDANTNSTLQLQAPRSPRTQAGSHSHRRPMQPSTIACTKPAICFDDQRPWLASERRKQRSALSI